MQPRSRKLFRHREIARLCKWDPPMGLDLGVRGIDFHHYMGDHRYAIAQSNRGVEKALGVDAGA